MRASEDILMLQLVGLMLQKGLDGVMMPNYHFMWHEADLVYVTKRGYLTEFEIKISKSDFKADKKKTCGNISKQEFLVSGKGANYFYYVAPKGLLSLNEMPEYAGFIEVDLTKYYGSTSYVKTAPKLHKNKREGIVQKIYEKSYYRYLERIIYPALRKMQKELNQKFLDNKDFS